MIKTAHHEAAHAVAAITFGLRASRVVFNEDGTGFARIGHVPDDGPELHSHVIAVLCGPAADARLLGISDWSMEGCKADFEWACEHIALLHPEDAEYVYGRLQTYWDEARAFVESHWPEIEHVALALTASRTLSAEDVRDITEGPACAGPSTGTP